jgi:sortase (surface protein transpeptidase)
LLRHGDIIEIIWNWKVYKYQIFKKLVKYPRQVKATYQYYAKQGKILTLMGCYPIGTDRQRMLIIAKQIENINQSLAMVK